MVFYLSDHAQYVVRVNITTPDISQNLACVFIPHPAVIKTVADNAVFYSANFWTDEVSMKIKAIEKTSKMTVAAANSIEELIEQAVSRKVSPDNLLFVVGDVDIMSYEFAREWSGRYKWLTLYFEKMGSQEYFVAAAKCRRELWITIVRSRVVEHESVIAPPLANVIGVSLADDVEQLIRMSNSSDCKVFGPDIKRSWADARIIAIALSRRHESRNYVLAVHEDLGAIVVAPDYKIDSNPGYKIKSYFQAGRAI